MYSLYWCITLSSITYDAIPVAPVAADAAYDTSMIELLSFTFVRPQDAWKAGIELRVVRTAKNR